MLSDDLYDYDSGRGSGCYEVHGVIVTVRVRALIDRCAVCRAECACVVSCIYGLYHSLL